MAMGALVVCPDCVGNRSFCIPGDTCFRPGYDVDAIEHAVDAALAASDADAERMISQAQAIAHTHDLLDERARFLQILHDLDALWAAQP
jgi:hypothetical protein